MTAPGQHKKACNNLVLPGAVATTLWCLGWSAVSGADLAGANLPSLTRAVRRAPNSDLAHYKLANALLAGGKKEAAMAEYRKAYILSQTDAMQAACQKALAFYRMPIPDNNNESVSRRIARAKLSQGTHATLDEFVAMTSQTPRSGKENVDSSPGGVETFKQCPEIGGAAGESWKRWNQDFRLAFESRLRARLARFGIPAIYGRTKLVFSVDKNKRLRSRVVASSVAKPIWLAMLDITRAMDGSRELQFPASSQIDGFNFAIGWTYPDPPIEVQQRLSALMRSNQTNAAVQNTTGLSAEALRMRSNLTTAEVDNVHGQLTRNSGSAAMAGKANELPGQNIDAQVSGQVMPKAKLEELKARPGKL